MKLLHLRTSQRGQRWHSTHNVEAFVAACLASHTDREVETIDTASTKLPPFASAVLAAVKASAAAASADIWAESQGTRLARA